MTPAIEDFAAIKARLDELRREKEQQQPLPDTENGDPVTIGLGPHQRFHPISIEPHPNSEPYLPQR